MNKSSGMEHQEVDRPPKCVGPSIYLNASRLHYLRGFLEFHCGMYHCEQPMAEAKLMHLVSLSTGILV